MSSSPHDSLSEQKALVTGATSGLGKAIALQLARDGAEVIVHGRNGERGAKVVGEIEAAGGKARFIGADLSHPDDVAALANAVGELDVLVNNSGSWWFGPTADLDRETFDALFAGNVRGPYYLVAAIAPGMAARGSGSIINVSSMVAEVGLPVAAAYGATKGAIEALTRSWAAEFSPQGVRVNAVSPGPVYTDGADHEQIEQLGTTTLLRRAAHPAEIAQVIAFLASPRASYVTGATVSVDGGRTAI
ncbi:MAG: hypothetical protein QOD04_2652 [Pseudonocardiales bacterium]|jgi:NAD(P)-dependent dehydrogenase (short-subunit alcohol dehydrogenase family)|nr:hypothetical protein [Pseudonocardiales bacterium]MDT7663096.1 hypothetical protein [Pseudonocardiales bacterium]